MLPLPVCRIGKIHRTGKATPQSVMGHLARTRPTPNADAKRLGDNVWLVGKPEMDLAVTIRDRLDQLGIRPRSNSVIASDIVLTVSRQFFTHNGDEEAEILDSRKVSSFQRVALAFARERFGNHIVTAVLHVDERTPHIHVILLPVIAPAQADGAWRLSARDLFSPENLSKLQQDWENTLRPLGVGRRTKRNRVRHVDAREYGGCVAEVDRADPSEDVELRAPSLQRFETARAYSGRIDAWASKENCRIKKAIRPLRRLALEGKLARVSRATSIELSVRLKKAIHTSLGRELLIDRLQLELEQHTPPTAASVAAAMGVEIVDANLSTIQAVMLHKKLSRERAIGFLAGNFGGEAAANAVREDYAIHFQNMRFDCVAENCQTPPIKTSPMPGGL